MLEKGTLISMVVLLVVDAILAVLVFIPAAVFNRVQPYSRGFFCNDLTISHPYLSNTVPSWLMITLSILIPATLALVIEIVFYSQLHLNPRLASHFLPIKLGHINIHSIVNRYCSAAVHFLAGWAIVLCFTNMGKVTIGRLRPHFFDACKPNWSNIVCTTAIQLSGNVTYEMAVYVRDFKCRETDPYRVRDALQSFPSGHTSISIYAAVFTSLYVQYRIHWRGLIFLRLFIQSVLILLATYCGLTRVSDYKHHPSDVIAGALLGFLVAVFQITIVWRLPRNYREIERSLRLKEIVAASNENDAINLQELNLSSSKTHSVSEQN